ncbi:MAG: hypothetical protein GDA53_04020 [Rhodobacteraceae bacterium]|nr:hypothetical protein [Paracoccaceae bacterium]
MKKLAINTSAIVLGASVSLAAQNPPPEVSRHFSTPELQGAATTRAWGIKLFDASLWQETAGRFSFNQKFALTLIYSQRFSKERIADNTVSEIVRVEGGSEDDHKSLRQKLVNCIPDVRNGFRITGVAESASRVSLYVQGRKGCTIDYPNLRERFFSIWLAPTSRDRRAAKRLTGV